MASAAATVRSSGGRAGVVSRRAAGLAELYVVRGGGQKITEGCGIARKAMQLPGRSLSVRVSRARGFIFEQLFVRRAVLLFEGIFYSLTVTAGELVIMVLSSALMGSRAIETARKRVAGGGG